MSIARSPDCYWAINDKRVDHIWRREGLSPARSPRAVGFGWPTGHVSRYGRSTATMFGPTTPCRGPHQPWTHVSHANVLDAWVWPLAEAFLGLSLNIIRSGDLSASDLPQQAAEPDESEGIGSASSVQQRSSWPTHAPIARPFRATRNLNRLALRRPAVVIGRSRRMPNVQIQRLTKS